MTLTAEEVTGSEVKLRWTGAANQNTYQFHGVIVYDKKKEAFTRFDVAYFAEYGERDYAPEGAEATYSPIAVSFELSPAKTPMDRLYPHLWTQWWRDDHRPVREAYFKTGE